MKKRKMAAAAAAGMMACISVLGCGAESNEASNAQTKEENQGNGEASGDFHDELPEDFKITIMVNDWTGSPNSGEHAEEILQMIEDHTGYDVEIMWVTSDNYNDKLSSVLAGGKDELPMILSVSANSGVVVSAAANGAFHPVEEYLYDKEAYPNLAQADPQISQAFTINNHLYGVYCQSGAVGRYGFGYRKDWADRLGLEEPKTVQDVYDMLYAFTYDDPDGNGEDDTYGLNLCSYTGPLDIMQTWFGCGNEWAENEDGTLIPVHMTQEYMEALDWFKKLYDDGLIASDWAIRDTGSWTDDNKNGVAGAYCDCTDNVRKIWDYYEQNGIKSVTDDAKTATMQMLPGIAKDASSDPKTLSYEIYGFFAITQAAESEAEVQACLEFLDKMNDPEAMMPAMYGLEGIHWQYNDAGEVERINPEDQALHKAYNGLNQMLTFIPSREPAGYTFAQDEQTKMQEKTFDESEEIAVFNPAIGYLSNSQTYITNGGNLDLIIDDARTQYIVGDIDQAGLQEAFDLWLSTGGQQVIDEVNEQYKNSQK